MRILFICDLNSVHSQKWIRYFIEKRHGVSIYSTTPFGKEFVGAPVFAAAPSENLAAGRNNFVSTLFRSPVMQVTAGLAEKLFISWKTLKIRRETAKHAGSATAFLSSVSPEVIHCLRIPNEGFTGALLDFEGPLVISTWGNDLTYWAKKPLLRGLTESTLEKAGLLFSDCERDIELSYKYGYSKAKPHLVVPGSGGMLPSDLEIGRVSLGGRNDFFEKVFQINTRPILLSLRGFGSQDIDNVPLLRAVRILLDRGTRFTLVIAGKKNGFRYHKLLRLIQRLELTRNVFLVDELPHPIALEALQSADFCISISRNDGTPNSMLESMTFGAIPLMSEIESIKEWITDGVNGYLFDPRKPASIANAIQKCLSDKAGHDAMAQKNFNLILERAQYTINMQRAENALINLINPNSQRE